MQLPGSQAKIINIIWLLNSKAIHYQRRSSLSERSQDSEDIISILGYMKRNRIIARRDRCKAVMDEHFWMDFTRAYDCAERWLSDVGLSLEAPSSPSYTPVTAPEGRRFRAFANRSDPTAGSTRQTSAGAGISSNRTNSSPRLSREPSSLQTGLYQRFSSRVTPSLNPSLDTARQTGGLREGDSIRATPRPNSSR